MVNGIFAVIGQEMDGRQGGFMSEMVKHPAVR